MSDQAGAGALLLLAAAQQTGLLAQLQTAIPQGTLPRTRLSQQSLISQQAALRTLLFLPVVGLRRVRDLRSYTSPGLALLLQRTAALGYRHVDRYLHEIAFAGAAARLTQALAAWTAQLWPAETTFYYIDGHRKPVYTEVAIPRGLIGRTGKILGCRALVLLHDHAGHPLLATTHRGDLHLTAGIPALLQQYQQAAGATAPQLIIDREAMSGPFLVDHQAAGRTAVTILRSNQYTDLTSFTLTGAWQPLLTEPGGRVVREVAPALFSLAVPDRPDTALVLTVALIRDHRHQEPAPVDTAPARWDADLTGAAQYWWKAGWVATPAPAPPTQARLIPIVTTAPTADPVELVAQYTARWPQQENIIRDWLLPLGLDTNHGYEKQAVANSEQSKKQRTLEERLTRVRKWTERKRQQSAAATARYNRRFNERRTREREIERILMHRQFDLEAQGVQGRALREALEEAAAPLVKELQQLDAGVDRAHRESTEADRKIERYCQEQRRLLRELEDLKARSRPMYELTNAQDQVMTMLKLGLANLGMWVREQFFPTSYARASWARLAPFFVLPGRVQGDATTVEVELRLFNDQQLNRDLAEVCQRVTAAAPRLPDGRRLHFRLRGAPCLTSDVSLRRVA